ncbi:PhoH family protein [Leptolyngbya cf. ectocarpi LEGE 11479]|uniref:PhoH-like protein n=1 Tax=Leptolyngbya cf. ectocarpi LEGE 11479 TaxID=1828722 RepID=A0A928X275_LEPEC|nr:PhoH family protein [Leptolyngbya ectocarpi]MBE9065168.1 PhoH family protein [Leptolyngbya cf. ectocarpi LEGE 11479]
MEGAVAFEFNSAEQAMAMAGYQEEAIKRLSQQTGAKLVMRGTTLLMSGTPKQVERSKRLVTSLESIWSQGQSVSVAEVMTAIHALDTNQEDDLGQLHGDVIARTRRGETIRAKTFRQRKYVNALRTRDLVFCTGPAGTGKTFLAAMVAVQAILEQQYERLILTRPAVEAGESLGFLPGDLQQKVDPYLRPLYDALHELIDPERIPSLMERGIIEVAPLAYMRGRTLSNAFVILDEAQNTTPAQMKMVLTRLGFKSRMVVTGDVTQTDLPNQRQSGLSMAVKVLKGVDGIAFSELTKADVVRHPLVQRIVAAYEQYEM